MQFQIFESQYIFLSIFYPQRNCLKITIHKPQFAFQKEIQIVVSLDCAVFKCLFQFFDSNSQTWMKKYPRSKFELYLIQTPCFAVQNFFLQKINSNMFQ